MSQGFAAWTSLECNAGPIEFGFHCFHPVGPARTNLPDAFVHFILHGSCFLPLVGAHIFEDLNCIFGEQVQCGEDGAVKTEAHSASENSISAQENRPAIFQASNTIFHIAVGVLQTAE